MSPRPILPFSKLSADKLIFPPIPISTATSNHSFYSRIKRKRTFVILIFIFYLLYSFIIRGYDIRKGRRELINAFGMTGKDTSGRSGSNGDLDSLAQLLTTSEESILSSPFDQIDAKKVLLTELGLEAEEAFKLGSTNYNSYQYQLETFIKNSFPLADSDEHNPESLINAMRSFFPLPSSISKSNTTPRKYPDIPEIIFQTAARREDEDVQLARVETWKTLHPNWNITFHDNERANEWVNERFRLERAPNYKEGDSEKSDRGIVGAWNKLVEPSVLRSDFWRYLVIASEGGIYVDIDVEAIKPINTWGDNPSWEGILAKDYVPPSFICGVEADVGDRADWALYYPRPLELSQWTFASARGHPILIDTIRRVVENAFIDTSANLSVVEKTGPGPWTDSILRYIKAKYGKVWSELRNLGEDGWRYFDEERSWGDIKVLSITGFSPGVDHMGAKSSDDRAAMVLHGFQGSWKEDTSSNIKEETKSLE